MYQKGMWTGRGCVYRTPEIFLSNSRIRTHRWLVKTAASNGIGPKVRGTLHQGRLSANKGAAVSALATTYPRLPFPFSLNLHFSHSHLTLLVRSYTKR